MSTALYGDALLNLTDPCQVRSECGAVTRLAAARWSSPLDEVDEAIVDQLDGATLDIGCGPGRFVTGVAARGLPVLGIDVAPVAVELTRRRGGLAVQRDVFDNVPGAGRWDWALLLDGNIGIGGSPARLLRRTAELLIATGRVMVELEPPGGSTGSRQVRLESGDRVGKWFPWAWVTLEALGPLAREAGLKIDHTWCRDGRWLSELSRA